MSESGGRPKALSFVPHRCARQRRKCRVAAEKAIENVGDAKRDELAIIRNGVAVLIGLFFGDDDGLDKADDGDDHCREQQPRHARGGEQRHHWLDKAGLGRADDGQARLVVEFKAPREKLRNDDEKHNAREEAHDLAVWEEPLADKLDRKQEKEADKAE